MSNPISDFFTNLANMFGLYTQTQMDAQTDRYRRMLAELSMQIQPKSAVTGKFLPKRRPE